MDSKKKKMQMKYTDKEEYWKHQEDGKRKCRNIVKDGKYLKKKKKY